jgi:hypothetical protein
MGRARQAGWGSSLDLAQFRQGLAVIVELCVERRERR